VQPRRSQCCGPWRSDRWGSCACWPILPLFGRLKCWKGIRQHCRSALPGRQYDMHHEYSCSCVRRKTHNLERTVIHTDAPCTSHQREACRSAPHFRLQGNISARPRLHQSLSLKPLVVRRSLSGEHCLVVSFVNTALSWRRWLPGTVSRGRHCTSSEDPGCNPVQTRLALT
jgi:hypothetical protein